MTASPARLAAHAGTALRCALRAAADRPPSRRARAAAGAAYLDLWVCGRLLRADPVAARHLVPRLLLESVDGLVVLLGPDLSCDSGPGAEYRRRARFLADAMWHADHTEHLTAVTARLPRLARGDDRLSRPLAPLRHLTLSVLEQERRHLLTTCAAATARYGRDQGGTDSAGDARHRAAADRYALLTAAAACLDDPQPGDGRARARLTGALSRLALRLDRDPDGSDTVRCAAVFDEVIAPRRTTAPTGPDTVRRPVASGPVSPGTAPGAQLVRRADGPGGDWTGGVRAALDDGRVVVLYGSVEEWAVPEGPGLRALLGGEYARWAGRRAGARQRFAAARQLMKHAVGTALGVRPLDLELARCPGGRPYVRGYDRLCLSLTHTGDTLVLALGTGGRLGVDTENTGRPVRADALARLMCTRDEAAGLAALPEAGRARVALRLWTLKEAYTKALGVGTRLPFRDFGFALHGDRAELRDAGGRPVQPAEWTFTTHWLDTGHVVSTAATRHR
ncbi:MULTISPECIES: type I polyketide synthase [unclassified Streptomyces]|uniref:type I polyketide synthase n=1 Tax=unclassified Streptomyces TaxID=2593676 RepID=UPI002E76168D|nr:MULTISPECIES: 4'-phosphopantetheinyl transferase superfamily protein [unclassified Streptomyces]MEE1758267.1 4'-phosphopantetheinyl transferase superfamily protein [Streptomyces sp. SP18BB07]MEE1832677.1 4'-phosphopantetheinyl transferase superfamily protein [Streptomyces sp. SP17KL33]